MEEFNIRKIIGKKDVREIVQELGFQFGPELAVLGPSGVLLLGGPCPAPETDLPVEVDGNVLCRVVGAPGIRPVAALVRFVLQREGQLRALAMETLDQYREIAMLNEIAESISASLEMEEVASLVLEKARTLAPCDNGSLMLLQEHSQFFDIIAAFGSKMEQRTTIRVGEGIVGHVMQTGKGEIVNDVLSDPRYIKGKNPARSLICVPLKTKNRVIGALNLSSDVPVTYLSRQLRILNTLASEVSVAVENATLYTSLRETFFNTVNTLADTIEKRDPYTGGHTRRVMIFSMAIGEEINLEKKEITNLRLAAILHDIGKICVSDAILLKPDRLTQEEFTAMKRHTLVGEEIISHIPNMRELVPGIKYHHEKFDGSGYPDGLKGETIPCVARIIAVADTFDAMTSDRPYRKGLSIDTALEELARFSGSQFDPVMVKAFLARFSDREELERLMREMD